MNQTPLLILTGIGLVGYAVFHGHNLNESCWMCPYKGTIFAVSSVGLGVFLAFTDD
jgi:hypothetical protein